jgi:hypothetical protein
MRAASQVRAWDAWASWSRCLAKRWAAGGGRRVAASSRDSSAASTSSGSRWSCEVVICSARQRRPGSTKPLSATTQAARCCRMRPRTASMPWSWSSLEAVGRVRSARTSAIGICRHGNPCPSCWPSTASGAGSAPSSWKVSSSTANGDGSVMSELLQEIGGSSALTGGLRRSHRRPRSAPAADLRRAQQLTAHLQVRSTAGSLTRCLEISHKQTVMPVATKVRTGSLLAGDEGP